MMTNMKKRRKQTQNLVEVVVSAGISGDTLQKMDEICTDEGLNHSTLLRRALIREIRRISQEKEHEAEAKAATLTRPMPGNPTTCAEEDSNHEYQSD
jgi:hypothetical protein